VVQFAIPVIVPPLIADLLFPAESHVVVSSYFRIGVMNRMARKQNEIKKTVLKWIKAISA